jgi:hypothetical protein
MICFNPYLNQNIGLIIMYYHKRTWIVSGPTFVSIHFLGHFKTMYTLASKKPNLFKLDINFCQLHMIKSKLPFLVSEM